LKRIVYIGNNLSNQNPTSLVLLAALLKENNFNITVYSNKQNKLFRLIHMCWGVLKNRKVDYILIDTYSTLNFYYALIISQLARLYSIKYIPILHGGNLPSRLIKSPILSKLIFDNSLINVAPSKYLLNEFQQKKFKTIHIPNAIQLKKYPIKKRICLEPKLLWVRAFDTIYNPEMAVKVLFEIKNKYSNASLCMVGPDKDGSLYKVKELAKKLKVFNSIEFTGFLSKKEWIKKSQDFDIFINTTNIDNTPMSVIEAMALGLTVISTNVGGIPYLIEDGVDGILVDKADYKLMADQIIKLIEENNQLLAENAREKVESFDSSEVVKRWMKLLN